MYQKGNEMLFAYTIATEGKNECRDSDVCVCVRVFVCVCVCGCVTMYVFVRVNVYISVVCVDCRKTPRLTHTHTL